MTSRPLSIALAMILAGCGGGSNTEPTGEARVVETLAYTLRLTPTSWPISGPEFTSPNGLIHVSARVESPVPVSYGISLLYLGGSVPHNEGPGGPSTQGRGPLLSGSWNVGFSGRYQVLLYPADRSPLPVPAGGVSIPAAFTVTHP
jgi:hypothetical protein